MAREGKGSVCGILATAVFLCTVFGTLELTPPLLKIKKRGEWVEGCWKGVDRNTKQEIVRRDGGRSEIKVGGRE